MTSLYRYVKENEDKAVGISAVQVGILKRMCAIYYKVKGATISYQLVNPVISWHSATTFSIPGGEACLSVDEAYEDSIPRWEMVNVTAYDCIRNKPITIRASGFDAVVLQHEIDHMNGILYIDYLLK